ncbi:MAG: hypothetical protein K2X82_32465 [Gemmataceae bacterium]|nr:hypothetical protein [Gemmataceae bacterium]
MFRIRYGLSLALLVGGIATMAMATPVPAINCDNKECRELKGPFTNKWVAPLVYAPCWEYEDPVCNDCKKGNPDQGCRDGAVDKPDCVEFDRQNGQEGPIVPTPEGMTLRYPVVPGPKSTQPCGRRCNNTPQFKSEQAIRNTDSVNEEPVGATRWVCKVWFKANP